MSRIPEEHKRVAILESLLEYIVSARDAGKSYRSKEIYYELEGEYMLISEEERQEAILEGREKGILEGKPEDARLMLAIDYAISDVFVITGLSEKDLVENGIELNR